MIAYSHYIWDFDGTLFDSYPHSIAALCAAAEHYGIPADPNAVSQAIHINFATAYRLLGLTQEQLALFHDLRARRDFLPPVTPFPGVQKALEALRMRGAKHYLFTHSSRHMSVDYLEEYGLAGLFTDFVTADLHFPAKPAPDGILYLLQRHAIPPKTAAMVGDREIDILSGRNAGIDGILFDPEASVSETQARYRIRTFSELLN